MELIKTPSFVAIDNISELIEKELKGKFEYEKIRTSVAQFLLKKGANNFVKLYNLSITQKTCKEFITNLNL